MDVDVADGSRKDHKAYVLFSTEETANAFEEAEPELALVDACVLLI